VTGSGSIRDMWDFGDPERSESRFREATDAAAPGSQRHLELRTQVARALGLQGRFAEAHAELDAVQASLSGSTPVAGLRVLLERGRVLNSAGDPQLARPLFEQAWEEGREVPQHDLAVDAAHMVAIVASGEDTAVWNRRALEYAETCGDPEAERWLGSLYNNMGWDAHERGDYAGALRFHERCWAWHRERHTGSGERIAKWSVAKQLRFLGRTSEALEMCEELLAEYLVAEPGGEGFVHEEMAELLLAAGDEGAARPHFRRAHELLFDVDWIEPDRIERIERLAAGPGDKT
jgi:tetratricopeptide (TPR) repeat protein